MKKLLSLIVALFAILPASAYSFYEDGIYYDKLSDNTVAVTYNTGLNSYSGDVTIPETVTYNGVTYSVTSISGSAFRDCSGLTSISIPNSVTEIGNYCFNGCSSLKDVTFEDGDATISLGYNYYSSSYIGKGLFYDCALEKLYLGRNLSYKSAQFYGSTPFAFNRSLTSVTIGNSVTSLGENCFYGCSGLTSVTIPNSVTEIGTSAFEFCSGLTSVSIPNSVIEIGASAFSWCSGLTSISIPNSVIEIGEYAFHNCTALQNVEYTPSADFAKLSASSFDESTFDKVTLIIKNPEKTVEAVHNSEWSKFRKIFYSENGKLYVPVIWESKLNALGAKYTYDKGCIVSPDVDAVVLKSDNCLSAFHRGCDITEQLLSSSGYSFKPDERWELNHIYNVCTEAVELTRNVTLTTAGTLFDELGLQDIQKITMLTISGEVNGTDLMVLNRMTQLQYLDMSNARIVEGGQTYRENLKTESDVIGPYFFYQLTNLQTLLLSNSAKAIKANALSDISSLTNVSIGKSTETIGQSAFSGCSKLVQISIPASVTSIGSDCFAKCDDLVYCRFEDGANPISITSNCFPSSLIDIYLGRNISNNALFKNQTKLISVTISGYVTSLPSSCFKGYSNLTSVIISGCVTSLPSSCFEDCSRLSSVTIGKSVTSLGNYCFDGCTSLTSLELPESISSLGTFCFYGCSKLSQINIPRKVTSLGSLCFCYCSSLTNVNLPDGLTSLGESCFKGCSSLTNVNLPDGLTSLGTSCFYNCSSLTNISLPDGLTSLGRSCFRGCSSLAEISIPDKIEKLIDSEFSGCSSLASLRLGIGMKSISDNSFSGCSAITKIVSLAPLPPVITSSVFSAVNKEECLLVVTKGSVVYYWADPVWHEFLNMSDDLLALDPLPAVTYGDGPVDLAAYAPQGASLVYESSNNDVARIDGTILTIVGAGVATIGASYDTDGGTPIEIVGQMRQLIVDKAELTVTARDITIHEGEELGEIELIIDGLCYDDTVDDIDELPMAKCEVNAASAPGVYDITFTGGSDRNYDFATIPAKVTVLPSDQDDIAETEALKNSVYTEGNSIIVKRANADDMISVFASNGSLIYNGRNERIDHLVNGFYIVRIGTDIFKIKL